MTTLKHEEFFTCYIGTDAKAVKVDGYTFGVEIHGMPWAFGTHKDDACSWHLTDIVTGLRVDGPHHTRRECVEIAESCSMREKMWRHYDENAELYMAKAEIFRRLVAGESMSAGVYNVTVSELAAMMRERHRYEEEPMVETTVETAIVTLEAMKAKGWPDVLVRQRNEGACIWVVGELGEHVEELVELGFKAGRSKYYGDGWWAKPSVE